MKSGEAKTKPKKQAKRKTPAKAKASRPVKAAVKPKKAAKPTKAPAKAKKAARSVKPAAKARGKTKAVPKPVKKRTTKPEERTQKKAPSGDRVKEILKLREDARRGRPRFQRQESWRYVRIGSAWRRPKGIDSRMRRRVRGAPKLAKIGYRGPAAARGLHPSGFRDVLVHNIAELDGLNPETDAVRLAAGLGARKRGEIMGRTEELGLKVLNPRGIRVIRAKEE